MISTAGRSSGSLCSRAEQRLGVGVCRNRGLFPAKLKESAGRGQMPRPGDSFWQGGVLLCPGEPGMCKGVPQQWEPLLCRDSKVLSTLLQHFCLFAALGLYTGKPEAFNVLAPNSVLCSPQASVDELWH